MQDIINFIVSNLDAIFAVILATHAVAVGIVNLTPTPKDDAIVAKVYTVIESLAGIFTHKAKDKGDTGPDEGSG